MNPFSPPSEQASNEAPATKRGAPRWLKIIGICFVLALALGFAGCVALLVRASASKGESQAYVRESLPPILGTWDEDQLLQHMTSETAAGAKTPAARAKLHAFFTTGRDRLGPFRSVGAPRQWSSHAQATVVYVRMSMPAHFEHGDADLNLVLVKRDGHWAYETFRLSSSVFESRSLE